MKKTIFILPLLAICLIAGMSSCEDALESPTKSSLDEQVIFSTPVLAEGALMGIHQSLAETNSYRGRYIPFYGINTDIEWYNSSENVNDDRAKLTGYDPSPNSTQMNTENNAWAKMYEAIERANLCIRGLRLYGNVEKNSELAQILGEALTLRAMIYNDLIKAWGDVPARFEPISPSTLYLPKTDRDTIYKQIIADLAEAENYVPWPNETAVTRTTERVNKAFVKGLRARICLAAAGYSQRPDGTIRRSNDPELSVDNLYPIVKQECIDIIESKTCKLGTFEQNFRNLCEDNVTAGLESLYEIPFSDGRGRVLYTFGVEHTTTDKYTQQAKGGQNGPLPYVYYDFDKDDIRRNITCVPYEWTNGKQVPRKLSSWCFGKLRYEWMKRVVTSTNDDGINWQCMRYADIYLMAAEAINELDGPEAAAPYLREIRKRAFPNNPEKVDAYMASVTASKEAFFNAIVNERALEFCGESLRKTDLIRWNLLSAKMNEAKQKLTRLSNREGEYYDLPDKIYYKTANDGESLIIYGLEHGHTDTEGAALNYESSKGWFVSNGVNTLTVDKINSLFQRDPDTRQFWPIWQVFIDSSNGMLTNDYGY
ncbi:MAG: RagB/SusD family nutrient uptake outer membrane protein [Paludibacteraceae bacterium]|nr:RagB/SusD family nutrient uptake outer membrane protein [Paludibacteraceae bacterium]